VVTLAEPGRAKFEVLAICTTNQAWLCLSHLTLHAVTCLAYFVGSQIPVCELRGAGGGTEMKAFSLHT
jgi:hypothetical protein